MLVLLSPAKTLQFDHQQQPPPLSTRFTLPQHIAQSQILLEEIQRLSRPKLKSLLKVSESLAALNFERFQNIDLDQYTTDPASLQLDAQHRQVSQRWLNMYVIT